MLERKRGWALILSVAIMLCTVSVFLSSDVYARRDSGYDRPSYTISSFWERVIDRIADASRGDHIQINAGTRTTMPADVLREMKYSGTTLSIKRSGKSTIVIRSYEIGRIPNSKNYYTLSSLAAVYRTVGTGTTSRASSSSSSQEFEYPEFEYPEYEYPSAAQSPRYAVPVQTPSVSAPSSSSSLTESSSSSSRPESSSEPASSSESEASSSSSEPDPEPVPPPDPDPEPPSTPDQPAAPAVTVNGLVQNPLAPLTFLFLLLSVMSTSGLIAAVATFLLWKRRRRVY